MSEKQKSLLQVFAEVLPDVSHRFCARHLHNNFKAEGFPGQALKKAFWKAARATIVEAFNMQMCYTLQL
ncbi:hypothetical protein P3S67_025391 [Capsicum chacoense]